MRGPASSTGALAAWITVSVIIGLLPDAAGQALFAPATQAYQSGASAHATWGALVADFTRDGLPDLVAGSMNLDRLDLFIGDGAGGFSPPVTTGGTAIGMRFPEASIDLNGDGRPDLITFSPPPVQQYLATPAGVFQSAGPVFSTPTTATGTILLEDLDGDQDLVYVRDMYLPSGILVTQVCTALNQANHRRACPSGAPGTLSIAATTAYAGNTGFLVSVSGAPPGAPGALGLSLGSASLTAGNCTLWLDLSPGQLVLPSGVLGVVMTDASGFASLNLPIPNSPQLLGIGAYAQWVIVDPAGTFVPNGIAYSLSDSRKLVIW
jgi:hypothetical protein